MSGLEDGAADTPYGGHSGEFLDVSMIDLQYTIHHVGTLSVNNDGASVDSFTVSAQKVTF